MVPGIFHFVFGMAEDFGGRPFSLSHYLAIRSAVDINNPQTVYFHYQYEPTGFWWQQVKPLLTLNKVEAPSEFMGRSLHHVAHKADVIRLQALRDWGGVYLDLDTICVKPLAPLYNHSFVIGEELRAKAEPKNWRQRIKMKIRNSLGSATGSQTNGLCNAVLLAEKNCAFINRWLETYKSFRSQGRDKYWNEHSVLIPLKLAALHPDELFITGPYSFHYPLYNSDGLRQLFEEVHSFPDAYVHHVWESFSWQKYLKPLTVTDIMQQDTTYNLLARRHLKEINAP